ncbi:MAG TPA: D-alanine--D-alanine ligase family protein [Candidatus Limnocylindrales bacterium]|nr:D-alanine--D-alanine ligase family protein [Candidatus Limnocylindrales bacterium]
MKGSRSLHVLVLVGGRSAEHPISLRSGATVVAALAQTPHRTTVVGITRDGVWVHGDLTDQLETARNAIIDLDGRGMRRVTVAWDGTSCRLYALDGSDLGDAGAAVDVVFPVLHGPNGEDGTVQGLLELARVPYVGAATTASALAMDKLAMKTLCAGAGLPQVEFLSAGDDDAAALDARVRSAFGYPCYVKPANLGSSVGVSRARDADELAAALAEARRHDERVLVERAVDAREIEIAVLGSKPPRLSPVGEIMPAQGFYDFDSKYVDATAGLRAPTEVPEDALVRIQEVAAAAWELIGGRGMARIDFFLERGSGNVLLNEINTIPGFTQISMYPRLWSAAGLELPELVETLLSLALERR